MTTFPLMDGPAIPWDAIAPHERQARRNHGQSLERLAQRGGLSCAEFWFVMNDLEWPRSPDVAGATSEGHKLATMLASLPFQLESLRVDVGRWQDKCAQVEAERDALGSVVTRQRSEIDMLRAENELLREHASQRVLDELARR